MSESSLSQDSRAQSADFSKACSKHGTFSCGLGALSKPKIQFYAKAVHLMVMALERRL